MLPVTTPAGAVTPRASARSPPSASSAESATTTARSLISARPETSASATAAGGMSPESSRKAASRAACPASDAADRADTTHGTTPAYSCGSSVPGSSGASSRIRWALVPLMPNPETPARRGRSSRGHARASVSSSTAPADQSTWGVGSCACRVGGSTPCRSAWTILITLPTPAAD